MSEIKGQLLGVILVLTIFGAMCAALIPAFQKYSTKIANEATDNTEIADAPEEVGPGFLLHY